MEKKDEAIAAAAVDEPNKDKKDGKKKNKKKKDEELSEEDQKIKDQMDQLAAALTVGDEKMTPQLALEEMGKALKEATSSMTSVPKPLKFLRSHYTALCDKYKTLSPGHMKANFADVLSVLATTTQKPGSREALKFRLVGTGVDLQSWGHEYIRNITGELAEEYKERNEKGEDVTELENMVDEISSMLIPRNAEVEAVDLLAETDHLHRLVPMVQDEGPVARLALYLQGVAGFAATHSDKNTCLTVCYELYMKFHEYPNALRVALKMNDEKKVAHVFHCCKDGIVEKQMAFLMIRSKVPPQVKEKVEENDELAEIFSGERICAHFAKLAKHMDVMEPKAPEQIYKSHLEEKRTTAVLDSAKQNLASSFVNAFVNAGYGKDTLMTVTDSKWVYKTKEHGMTSAVASLGAICQWNVDDGLAQIDKYQWSTDNYLKAGAMLGFGICMTGIKTETDPAWPLLAESLESEVPEIKLAAVVGLGYAYAGTGRDDMDECLTPMIVGTDDSIEISAMAAVTVGLIHVSTCKEEAASAIMESLVERAAAEGGTSGTWPHFFAVGLGLLFLGQQDAVESLLPDLEVLTNMVPRFGKVAKNIILGFAYACSGDVLQVQKMLFQCQESCEEEDGFHQTVAVLSIALIACGENIGSEMAVRMLDHILQYSDVHLRRAVPLALGLAHISYPKVSIIDTLAKLSHDPDSDVALGAVFAMGLIGAGTNNARIAGLLRQLAAYYAKDADALFMVRISQGLLYMAKGLVTLSPFFSDRFLCDPVSLGSIMVVLHSILHMKGTVLSKSHYLLYHIMPAMRPRWLVTLDEDLKEINVSVRVGQAVDTAGMPGRPKQITGFQTRTTPVLFNHQERAELATDEYKAGVTVLEGFVILHKNPDYVKA